MNSEHIKSAVSKINYITATDDKYFITDQCKNAVNDLFVDLSVYFREAPTTAIALVQYLIDREFNVSGLRNIGYENYVSIFADKFNKLTSSQLDQIRKISKKLML